MEILRLRLRMTENLIYAVFKDIRYIPWVLSEGTPQSYFDERFREGLDKAVSVLSSLIDAVPAACKKKLVQKIQDLENRILSHNRVLQKLKEKKASYGFDARPYILIEIEDKEAEVEEWQIELKELKFELKNSIFSIIRGKSALYRTK